MQTTKTFRIFISSTFADMTQERRYLQERVFPELREFCRQNGAKFQAIDLRWGVDKNTSEEQKTMRLCIEEIHRCQEISPQPNFIVLFGNRYGWEPVPEIIPSIEMDEIIAALEEYANNERIELIMKWYREDENATPSEYVLLPKGKNDDWKGDEPKLLEALHYAVEKLPFKKEQLNKYFNSATHQEIIEGAFSHENAKRHVFSYFRSIVNKSHLAGEDVKTYFETEPDKINKLEKLKTELGKKLDESHIFKYNAIWNPETKGFGNEELVKFGNKVKQNLQEIITEEIEVIKSKGDFGQEIEAHREFKEKLTNGFAGREEELRKIFKYIDNQESKPFFCITGSPGSGKSSIMAKAITEVGKHPGKTIIYRFTGITPGSSDMLSLYKGINREFSERLGTDFQKLNHEIIRELGIKDEKRIHQIALQRLCENANKLNLKFVFIIDALDQINNVENILLEEWLPGEIYPNIKFVFSILDSHYGLVKDGEVESISERIPPSVAAEILKGWMKGIHRKLTAEQLDGIIEAYNHSNPVIFLRLCFELSKGWHSFSEDRIEEKSIEDLLKRYFDNLEKHHNKKVVKTALGYLLSGKYGLTEDEIIDLFVFDNKSQEDKYKYHGPAFWEDFLDDEKLVRKSHQKELLDVGKFPVTVWSRLLLDLMPFISERDIPGGRAFVFFHSIMGEFARKRYYEPYRDRWHNNLSDYFEDNCVNPLYTDKGRRSPNLRRLVEQPYQETLAGQWNDLYTHTLGNYEFIEAKVKTGMLDEILTDYEFAEQADSKEQLKSEFFVWKSFLHSNMHLLRRGDEHWPAYKILLQLAFEHGDESPVSIASNMYIKNREDDETMKWLWLGKDRRARHPGDAIIFSFEGHEKGVLGTSVMKNGNIVSWSRDTTIRLWDRKGLLLNTMKINSDLGFEYGNCVLELSEGRFVFWTDKKSIYLFDKYGTCLKSDEELPSTVKGAVKLKNGNILTFSDENTLQEWNDRLKRVRVLNGHEKKINGLSVLQNKTILSWSDDGSLRVWDIEGQNKVLGNHSGKVAGAVELSDGRVLSWADDRSLIIWDKKGTGINVDRASERDKINAILGAIVLSDQKILTWSGNNFLTLRDSDGTFLKTLEQDNMMPVRGVICLSSGNVVSWGEENALYLWNSGGEFINKMEGHATHVKGAIELNDGDIATCEGKNDIIRGKKICFWDQGGKLKNTLDGHSFSVSALYPLSDGKLLSTSFDSNMIIWNKEGRIIPRPGHHTPVERFIVLENNNVLSYSDKENVHILWSPEGDLLWEKTLTQKECRDEFELSNNKIATDSGDGTMHLWDQKGNRVGEIKPGPWDGFVELSNDILIFISKEWINNQKTKNDAKWKLTYKCLNSRGEHQTLSGEILQWINELADYTPGFNFSWSKKTKLVVWKVPDKDLTIDKKTPGWINGSIAFSNIYGSGDDRFWLEDKDGSLTQKLERLRNHLESGNGLKCLNARFISGKTKKFFRDRKFPSSYIEGYLPVQWHGENILESQILHNGSVCITQSDGQVCILKPYKGLRPLTPDELKIEIEKQEPKPRGVTA